MNGAPGPKALINQGLLEALMLEPFASMHKFAGPAVSELACMHAGWCVSVGGNACVPCGFHGAKMQLAKEKKQKNAQGVLALL